MASPGFSDLGHMRQQSILSALRVRGQESAGSNSSPLVSLSSLPSLLVTVTDSGSKSLLPNVRRASVLAVQFIGPL